MSYLSEVLADSPLWFPECDETSGTTAADSSGNARNAAINGAVGLGATKVRPGGVTAFDFPGAISAYLRVSSGSWMQVSSFTITAWVQTDAIGSYQCIWSRDSSGTGVRGPSFYITPAGKLLLFAGTDNLGTATLSAGTNYFVAATFDASTSTVTLYVNGSVDATITSASVPNSGAYDIFVGASLAASFGLNFPFDGRIDDVAYFGSALSASRIAAHYTAGTTASPDATVTPPAATATATAPAPVIVAPATVTPPAATATATAPAPSIGAGGNRTVSPPAATATASAPVPTLLVTVATDTTNALDGLDITFTGTAAVVRPPAPVPSGLVLAEKYDKAIAYPQPVMDNGRPT